MRDQERRDQILRSQERRKQSLFMPSKSLIFSLLLCIGPLRDLSWLYYDYGRAFIYSLGSLYCAFKGSLRNVQALYLWFTTFIGTLCIQKKSYSVTKKSYPFQTHSPCSYINPFLLSLWNKERRIVYIPKEVLRDNNISFLRLTLQAQELIKLLDPRISFRI